MVNNTRDINLLILITMLYNCFTKVFSKNGTKKSLLKNMKKILYSRIDLLLVYRKFCSGVPDFFCSNFLY